MKKRRSNKFKKRRNNQMDIPLIGIAVCMGYALAKMGVTVTVIKPNDNNQEGVEDA